MTDDGTLVTLDASKYKIVKRELHVPALDEVKSVFIEALRKNFAEAEVEVVDCPDLTEEPFGLAAPGLGGRVSILEIGGPSYLLPLVQRDRLYDVRQVLRDVRYGERAFCAGAGAGPWPHLGTNCEMMLNLMLDSARVRNETRVATVGPPPERACVLAGLPATETRFAVLANLFACEGIGGKVLKVHAKTRLGSLDFVATMQQALAGHYEDRLVGLGGAFVVRQGKAKQHVMPDFSNTPIDSVRELDNWLHYYDMSAPLVAVGTFVSAETELDLRVQHFHSFSSHGEGGHYHIDTTPETVDYLGYFNLGEMLYRIDQPERRLAFGKD